MHSGLEQIQKSKLTLEVNATFWINLFLFICVGPIPECLGLGCSGGGGGRGWGHLVPVPPSWRTDAGFRKKVKFLLLAQMFILVMSLQYWVQLQTNHLQSFPLLGPSPLV